jgi:peptide/bleomycin uptake transporter
MQLKSTCWSVIGNETFLSQWAMTLAVMAVSTPCGSLGAASSATTVEDLGVDLVSAGLTLLAFLPVLAKLSSNVTELPIIGSSSVGVGSSCIRLSFLGSSVFVVPLRDLLPEGSCCLATFLAPVWPRCRRSICPG